MSYEEQRRQRKQYHEKRRQQQQQRNQDSSKALQFPSEFQKYIDDLESLVEYTPRDVRHHHGDGMPNVTFYQDVVEDQEIAQWEDIPQHGVLDMDTPPPPLPLPDGDKITENGISPLESTSQSHDFDYETSSIVPSEEEEEVRGEDDESDDKVDSDNNNGVDVGLQRRRHFGASMSRHGVAHVYFKLPPPRLPLIPVLERDAKAEENEETSEDRNQEKPLEKVLSDLNLRTFTVSNEEDFVALKERVDSYLHKVESRLRQAFRFIDTGQDVVYHQIVRDTRVNGRDEHGNEWESRRVSHRPTVVILKNALDAADDLLKEIDRSNKETTLKMKYNAI